MTTWFTSDLHIGHRWAASVRFPSGGDVAAHDAHLAEQWDKWVRHDDLVWVLGDLSMESGARNAIEWIRERPGTKHLITGNHDRCHTGIHRDGYAYTATYLTAFHSVQPFLRRRIFTKNHGAQEVLLSHFPYRGSPYGDRYEGSDPFNRFEQWRLPNMGAWLLHGHTHSTDRQHGRSIHVGVDAWDWALVSLETITAMMEAWNPDVVARLETWMSVHGWEIESAVGSYRVWCMADGNGVAVIRVAIMRDLPVDDVVSAVAVSMGLPAAAIMDDIGEFRS